MATTDNSYGGYSIKGYREAGGDETTMFSATLTRDGAEVARVSNSGTGGCHMFTFRDRVERDRWAALAERLLPSRFEPQDELFDRLLTVAQFNRARSVAFIFDGMDPFEDGQYRAYSSKVTFDEAVRHLSGPGFAGKNPKVWVKSRSEFVPVADLVSV